jgi:tetratricopeptide (TPR) repeat protein
MTHSSLEFHDLMKPLLLGLLGWAVINRLLKLALILDLSRLDPYGFIKHAKLLSFTSLGSGRRLWLDRSLAMSQYIQGDAKSADVSMLNWCRKLTGGHLSDQLQIRLFGCLFACDDDGIIDTGLQMSQSKKFYPLNRLILVAAFFRRRRYKEAIEFVDSIVDKKQVPAITMTAYFAGYYARIGCEKELEKTLSWLDEHKYPSSNDWRLHLQAVCAAANGNSDKARELLQQALSEITDFSVLHTPKAVIARMTSRRVEDDLAKLESEVDDKIVDLTLYRKDLKQIAKRLGIAGEHAG